MNFVRSSGCLLGLLMMSNGISVAAVFAPNDRIVTDPAQSVRDPEFDRTENLMVWQDELNQLWLADIDPDTGDISPFNGKGQLIDTALSNLAAVGNGPEFGYGNGETILCYTRTLSSTRVLSTASKDELGNWVPALEDLGANRYRPICSPEGTADPARMIYVQDVAPGESVVNWRVVGNYATERSFPGLSGVGGRWAATKNAFVSVAKVNNVWQLFWTDIDLETSEQITFEASAKFNAFAWYAPEFDDVLISAAVDFMNVGIYRRIGGVWTRIYTFKVPSTFQFVSSPEPFVHNGKSFIAVIAASQLRSTPPLPYIPSGPSEVWIANIDPAQPFFRRIDNGQSGLMRLEPEPVALATGAVVYFTEQDPLTEKSVTRIAKTGLGSPAAGDSDGDAVSDDADNCTAVINADQVDADKDGIGNRCDADVNNDCIVNNTDLGIIRSNFTTGLPSADINVNGVVDWTDFSLARQQLTKAPGPAAVPNVCQAQ